MPPPVAVAADDIVDDGAGFADHASVVRDDRRLAERVDRFQLRRSEPGCWVPLIMPDVIRNREFLEQPKDALGAGIVEVVDDDNGGFSQL